MIPHPGVQAPAVMGAVVDGMDVVIVGQGLALSDADRRRITARARERGSVVLAEQEWPGAHLQLTVERSRWSGLGAGEGRLRKRDVTVAVKGRGIAATRRVLIPLDVDPQALTWRHGMSRDAAGGRALDTEVA